MCTRFLRLSSLCGRGWTNIIVIAIKYIIGVMCIAIYCRRLTLVGLAYLKYDRFLEHWWWLWGRHYTIIWSERCGFHVSFLIGTINTVCAMNVLHEGRDTSKGMGSDGASGSIQGSDFRSPRFCSTYWCSGCGHLQPATLLVLKVKTFHRTISLVVGKGPKLHHALQSLQPF